MAVAHMLIFHKYLLIFVVTLIVIIESDAYSDNLNKPCKFLDSINITDGSPNDDGSITFEGINYPKNLYAWYDYEFVNNSYRQPAIPHIRGCTCKLGKPCIRMCCPRGQIRLEKHCHSNNSVFDLPATVTKNDKSVTTENIFDIFHHVVGNPCHDIVAMEPELFPDSDTWILFENGSVRLGLDSIAILNKNSYCLNPVHRNDSFELYLLTCFEEFLDFHDHKNFWIPYGMFISVPFFLATLLVYIVLPELRNVLGKSLMCYLLVLIVGYITLGWIKLNGSTYVEAQLCRTLGYIVYFTFISAFFWLNVISFDIWWNLRGKHIINKFGEIKTFVIYSTYAWGSTLFLAVLCYSMDASSISTRFQPGMGVETCFLKKARFSEFLYFYLPIILITACNSVFFVLSALKIRKVQITASRAKVDNSTHGTHFNNYQKSTFVVYLRLFIVMGISWTMEAISWLVAPGAWYFYATDFMNAIQGVIIFLLFVMNQKTRKLIVKRWNICCGKERKLGAMSETGTSSAANPVNKNPTEVALMPDEKN